LLSPESHSIKIQAALLLIPPSKHRTVELSLLVKLTLVNAGFIIVGVGQRPEKSRRWILTQASIMNQQASFILPAE
jgi:hypothetical protein